MTAELLIAVASSGVFGAVGSGVLAVLKMRSESASSEARVMEVVHEVYDETVTMLREEINDNRAQIHMMQDEMADMVVENGRLRGRVAFLEAWIVQKGYPLPEED